MPDFFSTPDDAGQIRQSELQTSLSDRLGAVASEPFQTLSLFRALRDASAGGDDLGVGAGGDLDVYSWQPLEERQAVFDAQRNAIPDVSIEDARARVKQEGLEGYFKLPDQPSMKEPVLSRMIDDAHERRDREVAIARGPQGFLPDALSFATSIGVGMMDPLNAAAFAMPVIGEAFANVVRGGDQR